MSEVAPQTIYLLGLNLGNDFIIYAAFHSRVDARQYAAQGMTRPITWLRKGNGREVAEIEGGSWVVQPLTLTPSVAYNSA